MKPKIQFDIKTIATLVAIVLIALASFTIFYPVDLGTDGKVFEIKEGSGLSEVAGNLKSEDLIRSKYIFIFYTLALGQDKNLKAGKYNLPAKISIHDILYILSEGLSEHDDVEVTIPEGMNVWEIDKVFSASGLTKSGEFANVAVGLEGQLFPDTYKFKKDATVEDIIERMTSNFSSKTKDVYSEDLIIASMLEKEAKTKEDMELVAGVIHRRLGLDMLLQIDATVAYGACLKTPSNRLCDVTLVGIANELKIDGPYNTYQRKGLLPGPISNPGLQAIQAAQNPKKSDSLYYLSTRDGSQIIYSKTADEHLRNRKKYLGF